VGLLFGHYAADGGGGRYVSIVDAEEMEHPDVICPGGRAGDGDRESQRAAIFKKIELYRKVFPQHRVVGWYRVEGASAAAGLHGDGAVPSEEDLRLNQTEMARYCRADPEAGGDEDGESPLFVLMQAPTGAVDDGGARKPATATPSALRNAAEEMEGDEALPLSVYETLPAEDGAVFVHTDFELETHESERIAVERVFKAPPSAAIPTCDVAASTVPAAAVEEEGGDRAHRQTGKKSKKDGVDAAPCDPPPAAAPFFARGPGLIDSQLAALRSSVRALHIRTAVLLEFLERVKQGDVPTDDALLRDVDGLVRQLPLVLASLEERPAAGDPGGRWPLRELNAEHGSAMLLTYLAAVAKTAKTVHLYSEKFHHVCEGGRGDPRRPLY